MTDDCREAVRQRSVETNVLERVEVGQIRCNYGLQTREGQRAARRTLDATLLKVLRSGCGVTARADSV